MCLSMSYKNLAGRLSIHAKEEAVEPIVRISWNLVHTNDITQAVQYQEHVEHIMYIVHRVTHLINTRSFSSGILLHSYVSKNRTLFTPYYCLKEQFCVGICHDTERIVFVPYGELLCEYKAVKKNISLQDVFWEAFNSQNNQDKYELFKQ